MRSRYTRANLKALCLDLTQVLRDVESAGMPAYNLPMVPRGSEIRFKVEAAIQKAESIVGGGNSQGRNNKRPLRLGKGLLSAGSALTLRYPPGDQSK